MNKRGIGLAVHYKPIHMLSYYQAKYNFKNEDYPRASNLFNNIVSLPIYPSLTDKSVKYIINCILDLYGNKKK